MSAYPVMTNDNEWIHDEHDMRSWLDRNGFPDVEQWIELLGGDADFQDRIDMLEDACDEQERINDEMLQCLRYAVDELTVIAQILESGKSGSGYTKAEVAIAVRAVIDYINVRS